MAKYNQVGYGSQGSDVTELQKLLNQNGYKLDEDGIFGSNTQAAVKDYQQKNNLSVDGIAGDQTWGSLSENIAATTPVEMPEKNADAFTYEEYKPSDTVTQAQQMLEQQLANKPGAYQSAWQTQLDDIINKIQNREKFSYDLNGDALYQQYKDQYTTQGKMAMMDTMGQAQAMTGGYGNSYAQSVGQQAYQGHLQQLNEVIPELYQLALDQYNREGQDLLNQYGLISDRENMDYGRYRDQVSDYYTDRDYYTEDYRYQSEMDYGKWADGRDFSYGQYRDEKSDEQWKAEFDEAKRQFDTLHGDETDSGSDKDGKPDTDPDYDPNPDPGYDNQGLSEEQIKNIQRSLGITVDGKWGAESKEAAGGLDAKAAYDAWNKGKLGKPVGWVAQYQNNNNTGFTGSTYSEAAAYLKEKGLSASGLMTQSEWQRHKNKNNSAGGEHEANTYQEYLAAYIYGMTNKK